MTAGLLHECYEALDDADAARFVADAITDATRFLGEPAAPIRIVHLRHSTPLDPRSGLPRGFRLCEAVDADKGEFAIYLSRRPGEIAFAGQLAHEVAHLLNPRLRDCYVEGVNTLFAERFLRKRNLDWTRWERHFRAGGDAFHGAAYWLMKDVADAAGAESLQTLLSFATPTEAVSGRMHIDIHGWIDTLAGTRRAAVRDAIWIHVERVRAAGDRVKSECHFLAP